MFFSDQERGKRLQDTVKDGHGVSDGPTGDGQLYKQAPEVHVKAMYINSLTVSKTTVLGYNVLVPIHNDSLYPMKKKYDTVWGRGLGKGRRHNFLRTNIFLYPISL